MPAPPKELEWVRFTRVIGWLHRAHQRVGVRYALLTTVPLVALALAGASAFLVSPYNHVMPVPRMVSTVHDLAAKVGVNLDRPLAPAASLANVPIPPPAGPMIRPKYVEPSRKEQLAELLRLHGDVAHVEPVTPAPPSDSTAPLREASPSGRLGTPLPTAPGGPAVTVASASPQGPASAPAGYVPREPGAPPEAPLAGVATVIGQPRASAAARHAGGSCLFPAGCGPHEDGGGFDRAPCPASGGAVRAFRIARLDDHQAERTCAGGNAARSRCPARRCVGYGSPGPDQSRQRVAAGAVDRTRSGPGTGTGDADGGHGARP